MRQQINEWFRDRGDQTLRLDYPLGPDSLVWDVGAYEGKWARSIHDKYGCYVDMFEPMPRFWTIAGREENDRVKLLRFGLSSTTGTAKMVDSSDGSSVSEGGDVLVTLVSMQDQVKRINRPIDLLKINIEGGEYDLLEHACETGCIAGIRDVQVQFHNFVPNAVERLLRVRDMLSKTHVRTWCYDFVWENWRLKETAE